MAVEPWLPICAAIVSQFVTHFDTTSAPPSESRRQALNFPAPTPGVELSQAI